MEKLSEEQLEAVIECNEKGNRKWTRPSFEELLQEKGLVGQKVEVGKWYIFNNGFTDSLVFVTKIINKEVWFYGVHSDGHWVDEDWYSISHTYTLATDKEVETALIKEAKKRGFEEGVEINHPKFGTNTTLRNGIFPYHYSGRISLIDNNNHGGSYIFRSGVWAEIIEPKTVKMTMAEVNKKFGYNVEIVE